jgi:hypothetical protein
MRGGADTPGGAGVEPAGCGSAIRHIPTNIRDNDTTISPTA